MGTWTLGADNATVRNVPEPGQGSDSGAPADSAVEPHQRHPFRRQVDLPRRHAQGRAPAAPTASRSTSATRSRIRRTTPRARARPKSEAERAAERAQHLRRDRRVGAIELRSPASIHRQRRLSAAVLRGSRLPSSEAMLGGWRANAIFVAQSGAPFTVNLGVDRANVGAGPAQRPDQLARPESSRRRSERPSAGSTRRRSRLPAQFTFGSAPRNSVLGPGFANVDCRAGEDLARRGARRARVPLGDLQPPQPRQLRPAEPSLRQRQLRPDLQREESARNAIRRPPQLLIRSDSLNHWRFHGWQ